MVTVLSDSGRKEKLVWHYWWKKGKAVIIEYDAFTNRHEIKDWRDQRELHGKGITYMGYEQQEGRRKYS